MGRVTRRLALIITILSASCAAPPNKEMNQAQGAIDAARAAGAEKFAASEFGDARDLLRRSEEAVAARDYRLALSLAMESRERAQNAARLAVDGRVEARGQAERTVAEVATLLDRALTELKAPALTRNNGRQLHSARGVIAETQKALQEARTALKIEDYAGVTSALRGVTARLQAALSEIDAASGPRPPTRRR